MVLAALDGLAERRQLMLIMNRDEAEKVLSHMYTLKLYYQNQSDLFKGHRAGLLFHKYMKEVMGIIDEMEAELRNGS
jgi:hypothetical protein